MDFRIPAIFFATLFVSSCANKTYDVSGHNYFLKYIGKSVSLKSEQRLCQSRDDDNYRVFRTIRLNSPTHACDLSEIVKLPIGTVVEIESVKEHWSPISGSAWYALGNVTVSGIKYEFEYFYGYIDIYRAPWENKKVPLKRRAPNRT